MVSAELVQLASEVTPYVAAAASAYGGAVLAQTQEEAATAAVGLGRRVAQRIFGMRGEDEEVPEALADVVDDPEDGDNLAALRKAIRKALAADELLAAEVAQLAEEARAAGMQVVASGERSAAVHTNHGIINTGDSNTFPQ